MYLIDQHAAQERVNYERYLKYLKNEKINTIDLLIPITIELPKSDFITVKNNIEKLEEIINGVEFNDLERKFIDLYYKQKKQPPTKWLASFVVKAYLTAKYKVGLFIFACCSYLCRQAV